MRLRDVDDALMAMRRPASDPLALMQISHEVARIRSADGTRAGSGGDALLFAARLLDTGRLKLAVVPVHVGGGQRVCRSGEYGQAEVAAAGSSFGAPVTPSAPPELPPPPLAPRARTTTHCIEIELLGEDDKPVPDTRYVLNLSDGREVSGRLDGKGFPRIDGISQPGSCRICFPDLDKGARNQIDSLGSR